MGTHSVFRWCRCGERWSAESPWLAGGGMVVPLDQSSQLYTELSLGAALRSTYV